MQRQIYYYRKQKDCYHWLKALRVKDAADRDDAISPYYDNGKDMNEIVKYLEANNIIEYVPYTDGE